MPESLPLIPSNADEKALLEHYVRELSRQKQPLNILEAGCGQKWVMELDGIHYSLTGIDLDGEALTLRKSLHNDLDVAIVGDLRDDSLINASFDVIYNAFVLEHIDKAEKVLDNFYQWLNPGGVIIIKVPDRQSVYGFLARHTPHWLHVGYYRYLKGCKEAGQPGFMPYPTVYDDIVSRQGLREYCLERGLVIELEAGKNNYLRRRNAVNTFIKWCAIVGSVLSLGYLRWQHNDLIFVLRKPDAPAPVENTAS